MPHVIKVDVLNVAEQKTRTQDARPYKELQVLFDEDTGICHQVKGTIKKHYIDDLNGKECQVIRVLVDVGGFVKIHHLIDYDLKREYQDETEIECLVYPYVYKNKNQVGVLFTVNDDQADYPELGNKVGVISIKDFKNRDWQKGILTLPVSFKSWISKSGVRGLSYTIAG